MNLDIFFTVFALFCFFASFDSYKKPEFAIDHKFNQSLFNFYSLNFFNTKYFGDVSNNPLQLRKGEILRLLHQFLQNPKVDVHQVQTNESTKIVTTLLFFELIWNSPTRFEKFIPILDPRLHTSYFLEISDDIFKTFNIKQFMLLIEKIKSTSSKNYSKNIKIDLYKFKNKINNFQDLFLLLSNISKAIVDFSPYKSTSHSVHIRGDSHHHRGHSHSHNGHSHKDTNNPDSGLDPDIAIKKSFNWKGCISAIGSCLAISLLGLSGFILKALESKEDLYKFILQLLAALAYGTLTGDAFLHLLPHGLKLHDHSHPEELHGHDHTAHSHNDLLAADSYIWKFSVLLIGVLFFYIIEVVLIFFPLLHQCPAHNAECCPDHHHDHHHENHHDHDKIEADNNSDAHSKQDNDSSQNTPLDSVKTSTNSQIAKLKKNIKKGKCESATLLKGKELESNNGAAVVLHRSLMLMIGDSLHHIIDGLALGAAFIIPWPLGFQLGASTFIAIACHELPHMLGDMGMLIDTGHSVDSSVLMVCVSTSTSLIGAIIGVTCSFTSKDAPLWINVFTAGMFLSIALTQLHPQLVSAFKHTNAKRGMIILAQLTGFFLGYLIMYLIAIFEDKIHL